MRSRTIAVPFYLRAAWAQALVVKLAVRTERWSCTLARDMDGAFLTPDMPASLPPRARGKLAGAVAQTRDAVRSA
jgi:hypothetical protein